MRKHDKKNNHESSDSAEQERETALDQELMPAAGDVNQSGAEAESAAAETPSDIEQARAEAAEWQDKYLRKLAEFDNFRRRTRQESEMLGQAVAETLIAALLPIMDDFDRMLTGSGGEDNPYRKGVELIRGKLWAFFESRGVTKCESVGKPFDPNEHDALLMKSTPDFPPGTILEEITPGYRIGDRILRHAQVIVSAEVEIAPPESENPSE